ncbi:MAG: fimbrillin family protein [Rikenellaceae bacterium]
MKRVIIATLALAALGCQSDGGGSLSGGSTQVEFTSATITTRVNAEGDEWVEGDGVGIYMSAAGASSFDADNSNVLYKANSGGESTTRFVPESDDEAILYLTSSNMDFAAYYPYSASLSGMLYSIDSSVQDETLDFMWAEALDQVRGTAIALPFTHRMAKIELIITHRDNLPSLAGLAVSLTGSSTQGSFDITTGELAGSLSASTTPISLATVSYVEDLAAEDGYTITTGDEVDRVVATAIIMPEALAGDATFTFSVDGRTFTKSLSGVEFLAGKINSYNISLGYEIAYFDGGSTIKSWGAEVDGGEIYSDVVATFASARINTRTVGDEWEADDRVGISMYSGSTALSGNIEYTSSAAGDLSPVTDPIYYPNSGLVDFYAYYPYQADMVDNTYLADISDQSDEGAIDLLSDSIIGASKSSEDITFNFSHRLAMVQFNATHKANILTFEGVIVSIEGVGCKASFDALSGAMIDGTTSGFDTPIALITAEAEPNEVGYVTTFTSTALLLPETTPVGTLLTITLPGGDSYSTPFEGQSLTPGKRHIYNLSVGYNEVTFGLSSVTGWEQNSSNSDELLDAEESTI